ncbi:MAG: sensor domain-containing diguanylate cyclase [Spirochaetaceae bacterium]|nr:MAG: sensor domain-containing diguanylate cyclase [Spirochaetaceae bacterium]
MPWTYINGTSFWVPACGSRIRICAASSVSFPSTDCCTLSPERVSSRLMDELQEPDGLISLRRDTLARMGVFVEHVDGRAGFVNRFRLDLGFAGRDMTGDAWLEHIHPEDRAAAADFAGKLRSGGMTHGRIVYRVRDAEGAWHWCMTTGVVEEDPRSGEKLLVGHDQDITYIKQLQHEADRARTLAEERAEEADILRYAGAIITASLDKREMIERVVDQLRRLLPIEHCIVFERNGRELNALFVGDEETESPVPLFLDGFGRQQVLECLREGLPGVIRDPRRSARFWLSVPLVVRGEPEGVCVMSRTDRQSFSALDVRKALAIADFLAVALSNGKLYEGMTMLATTDQLTGLLNRHAFFLEAEQMCGEACQSGSPLVCLLADIDHFKSVNDEFGHLAGDQVIRTIASCLKRSLREVDLLGRFGGEEFVALLPGVALTEALSVAERVRARIEDVRFRDFERTVTCSVGLAVLESERPDFRPGFDATLARADAALYRAKSMGRNRVEVYES